MDLEIRRANHSDAEKIIVVHRKSIREVCSKDYTPEQIAAWSGKNFRPEVWQETMDKDLVWVISDSANDIYGFGHLQFHENQEAEIAGLYFVPEVIGRGLGKKLVQAMFIECEQRNIGKVQLYATLTARKFYESVGFKLVGDPLSINIGGKKIECLRMQISGA